MEKELHYFSLVNIIMPHTVKFHVEEEESRAGREGEREGGRGGREGVCKRWGIRTLSL